jgi:taurine-pyruvate aminotransferase
LREITENKRLILASASTPGNGWPLCSAKEVVESNPAPPRSKGLLIGVELVEDRNTKEQLDAAPLASVVDFCRDDRVIVGRAGGGRGFGTTITLCPLLVITRAESDCIVETLSRALQALDLGRCAIACATGKGAALIGQRAGLAGTQRTTRAPAKKS